MDGNNALACRNELPELPFDKEYHILLCYSNEDEGVATLLVENLEKLNLKCCFHRRDFTPGVEILSYVDKSIKDSMHVVIVLSENYYNSRYCSHETNRALHSKQQHRTNVMPVKIEPCRIPSTLSHLTYVDGENGNYDDLHTEIFNAIVKQEVTPDEEFVKTGNSLRIEPHMLGLYRRTVKYEFIQEVRQQFEQISGESFDLAEQMINNAWLVRNKVTFDYSGRIFLMGLLFVYIFWALTYCLERLICYTGKALPNAPKCTSSINGMDILCLGITLLLAACFLPFCPCFRRLLQSLRHKACEDLNKRLWEKINQSLLWKRHAIIFYDKSDVVIMQYNPDPCVSYFCRHDDKFDRKRKHDHETNEAFARRLFGEFLSQYQHMLLVSNREEERHKTYNNAPCLCLLVETWLKQ